MATSKIQRDKHFIVRWQKIRESGSFNNNSGFVTPTAYAGYKAVGIVGWQEGMNQLVNYYNLSMTDGGQIYYGWRVIDGNSVTDHYFYVFVLYEST